MVVQNICFYLQFVNIVILIYLDIIIIMRRIIYLFDSTILLLIFIMPG
jgi:hypothetical protein